MEPNVEQVRAYFATLKQAGIKSISRGNLLQYLMSIGMSHVEKAIDKMISAKDIIKLSNGKLVWNQLKNKMW